MYMQSRFNRTDRGILLSDEILLDITTFEALSSETRISILKNLEARPMTVSEISKILNIPKSSAYTHLAKMLASNLVRRKENDHKWVYYEISYKGYALLHPSKIQQVKIILTTALGIGACGLAVLGVDILSNLPSPEAGVALGSLAASSLFTTGLMLLATGSLLFVLAVFLLMSRSDFIPIGD